MRIVIAGSSGLIGTELVNPLRADGHEIIRLVRRKAVAPTEVSWDPANQQLDVVSLGKVDAIINLAGAGVGDHPWSDSYKKTILSSRVDTTSLLARVSAEIEPEVFISASAIGWYGDTADRKVDESSPAGEGFLADVVKQWEAAADPARAAGIRVVHPRTGLVSSPKGGAWGKLLPLFKLGLGGKLGNGKQYWSFISMRDEISALKFLLTNHSINGPVNLTAPLPATNAEVTKAMSKAFKRPALAHVPAFALELVLGEFSQEVLGSSRVIPQVLLDAGFSFQDPNIESAMKNLAGN
jgi:uncharacterized protein (TIGR01777 family)